MFARRRMTLVVGLVAGLIVLSLPGIAEAARIVARVNLSTQTMTVTRNGWPVAKWAVSTARRGKITPTGTYTAEWLSRYHKSSRYNNAPMPHAIFFHGHYAVHGTDQISRLGRPASAGCVRLHPENAAKLFEMAKAAGLENVQIVITD
jgi:lipoprotein-anchoring transpeptidase ErfK/SrfK